MSKNPNRLDIVFSGNLPEKFARLREYLSQGGLIDTENTDVLTAAIRQFERDMTHINATDWQLLVLEYKRLSALVPGPKERKTRHEGEMSAYIKDADWAVLDRIRDYAHERELAPVQVASDRPINRKLIVCMAVLHLYDKFIGEGA